VFLIASDPPLASAPECAGSLVIVAGIGGNDSGGELERDREVNRAENLHHDR
jgi:hypothetical protein